MQRPHLTLLVTAALLLAGCLTSQDSNDSADSGLEGDADPCDAVLVDHHRATAASGTGT